MIVISIDPCSIKNLGFAVKEDDNLITYGTFNPDEPILSSIFDFTTELIEDYEPDILIVESSIGFGHAPTRSKIAENTGVIKLAAQQKNIKINTINARHCFKVVLGTLKRGDNKKTKTIEHFEQNYSLKLSEHEADALLMIECFKIEGGLNVK